jgi:hypothetical protein
MLGQNVLEHPAAWFGPMWFFHVSQSKNPTENVTCMDYPLCKLTAELLEPF